jgi:thiamine pyrophosphate-dependent acetolactate synthase large subunit-like protein
MKVLEALAAAIAAEGIDHIFAVMGDANQEIIVELCEKHELKYVHAHHETAAVGMVDGYARLRALRLQPWGSCFWSPSH